ncbi:prenylated rab acceptor 1 [Pyrenophora seminiperda CCB06]|uniref:Prenylated rab acceptor 1 n=1 Tax=Pyrenophora seminiperda CCB06 TaxID=1302712 RepID=A0A3M7MHK4_9PLEO|nr:prenylated rab acceptor 1 [Pyrenophora seminiperda CCB06]
MSRFSIPIDALTSRMNFGGRFDSLRSTSVSSRFANLRPISEFFDVKRISKPANFSEVQSRVNYNLGYFSSNYAAVFVMLSIYSLLTNLMLLFVICLVVGGMFGIGKLEGNDLQLGSWRATTSQLYTALFVIAIPLGLWASPFTTVLWLIGATGVTVVGHAAFMDKPIEPPGGSPGVGRYYEGGGEDVHRFQDLGSDDEKGGVILDPDFQPAVNGRSINPDELYFNDMDIRAWEGRASALAEVTYGQENGYQEDGEGRFDSAEHEEMLFRRVLDKIRIARAAGNADVSLSPEELHAYQSRLYGLRVPATRRQAQSRHSSASAPTDGVSVVSVTRDGKHGTSSSGSKKNKKRSSPFSSKSRREKQPNSRTRTSTMSTADNFAPPPGFVIPGPDGQSMYTPINAYPGSLGREHEPLRPTSHPTSDVSHDVSTLSAIMTRDMLGAYPESMYDYQPATPRSQGRTIPSVSGTRSSSIQSSRLVPFPVEPYQYHSFSPASSLPPTSPQPQYSRSVSSGVSEASYASIPRRVPVPSPAPTPLQRAAAFGGGQGSPSDPALVTLSSGSVTPVRVPEVGKDVGSGHGVEKRRKSGKSSKKG